MSDGRFLGGRRVSWAGWGQSKLNLGVRNIALWVSKQAEKDSEKTSCSSLAIQGVLEVGLFSCGNRATQLLETSLWLSSHNLASQSGDCTKLTTVLTDTLRGGGDIPDTLAPGREGSG